MKFTASRLSEGNKVFPTQIILEENSIEIKSPGLFSGDSKYLNYEDINLYRSRFSDDRLFYIKVILNRQQD